jgi:hypothetical protein
MIPPELAGIKGRGKTAANGGQSPQSLARMKMLHHHGGRPVAYENHVNAAIVGDGQCNEAKYGQKLVKPPNRHHEQTRFFKISRYRWIGHRGRRCDRPRA